MHSRGQKQERTERTTLHMRRTTDRHTHRRNRRNRTNDVGRQLLSVTIYVEMVRLWIL